LTFALEDCGAVAAIVDVERSERISPTLPRAVRRVLVARAEGALGSLAEPMGLDLPDRLDSVAELPEADVGPDDLATIFYTSGTTGSPKGVLGTHRNICTNLLSRAFWRTCHASLAGEALDDPARGVALLTVPLFHVTGCHSYLLPALASGSTLVLMERWDPQEALTLIERERVTVLGGVPTTALQLMNAYDPRLHDLSSLTSITVGGAPSPPALFERIHDLLPRVALGNGYGMTETSSVAIYNFGADCLERPSSIGRLVPVMDHRVVTPEGSDADVGSEGELWLRGPNVFSGYWQRPIETAENRTDDGWLKTGDLVEVDGDGSFSLVGRTKDLIVRGGEKISPSEVESALYSHPAVVDAAVAGNPHPDLGEEVVAFVLLRPGSAVSADDLRQHVRRRLAHFKVPASIYLVTDPLPRNPQGKLLRRQLRAMTSELS
jgi:long-chain acyl-CoA synthetase